VGVLPAPERVSGQRRYGEETVRRLEMIDMDELRWLLKAQRCSCFSLELCALFAGDDAA
jgi:DNA-binding transcriptional MerR regulator